MIAPRRHHTREHAQLRQLGGLDRTPARALDAVGGDGPVLHADEALHLVADGLHHSVDLPVAALRDGELDPRVLAVFRDACACDDGLSNRAVELDAGLELRGIRVVKHATQLGVVRLWHRAPRVHEPVGKIAVVGEKQHALGVEVETPHGVDARPVLRQQIYDGGTTLGIVQRRNAATWLVQHEVTLALDDDELAVDLDAILRLDARAELRDLAVDAHAAFRDEDLCLAAGGDAGLREVALQSG